MQLGHSHAKLTLTALLDKFPTSFAVSGAILALLKLSKLVTQTVVMMMDETTKPVPGQWEVVIEVGKGAILCGWD